MNLWWQRTTYSYWESIMVHWSDEEEMKEMFYLMMHSTHFFTVICQTYGKGPFREELCCYHYMGYSFRLAARVLLYAPFHKQDNTYHNMEHWLEREIVQWVHHEGSIRRPIAPWANALPLSYMSLPLPPLHGLLFLSSKGSFICAILQTG